MHLTFYTFKRPNFTKLSCWASKYASKFKIKTHLTSYTYQRPKPTKTKLWGFKIYVDNWTSTHIWCLTPPKKPKPTKHAIALELHNMYQTINSSTHLTSYTFITPKTTKIKLLGFKICINIWTSSHIWPPKSNLKNQTNTNKKKKLQSLQPRIPTICVLKEKGEARRITTIEGREIDDGNDI